MIRPALSVLLLLSLTACVSLSHSQAVAPLSSAVARTMRIDTVEVVKPPDIQVSAEFDAIFQTRVKAKLDRCATGAQPLKLVVNLDRLDKANPLMTAAFRGANELRGYALLIEPASGRTLATYRIGKSIVGSRLAVITMAQAEEQLSDAFGDELCKQAFR